MTPTPSGRTSPRRRGGDRGRTRTPPTNARPTPGLSPTKIAGPGVPRLVLRPEREKSLQRQHPWVFSGGVDRVEGEPGSGDTVEIRSSTGGFLARGAYSPDSQIIARVWDFHEGSVIDAGFFVERIRKAAERRARLLDDEALEAVRLVHGEADGLPGVVLDRFGDVGVLQLTTAGAWRWRDTIADSVTAVTGLAHIFERSDAEVLHLEGLPPRVGSLRGQPPDDTIEVNENGLAFAVDVQAGHKTGFYLDQRDNRALLRDLVEGREVLDCFCYTGGFAVNALAGGAAFVTAVDSSGEALAAARRHVVRNGLPEARLDLVEADVFALLRKFRDQGRKFDVIVLDPPKFAPTAALAQRAARGYKDINLWAMKLLRPGGLLFTFSCSGGIHRDLFQKIVAGASTDAGVEARILHHMSAAADHPVLLSFPEGEYLKGLLCEIG
ncbi:MAG: methyltransferase domain-containing protein [Betaproteobacteria bacterium]|nr:methyltransferase domain-containing protein [Betaproteobacteria bacterium]